MNEMNNNYEVKANEAMDLVSEAVAKKAGIHPVAKLGLVTLVVGAGYALVKGALKLIEINEEKKAFRPGNMEEETPVDADFEPVE